MEELREIGGNGSNTKKNKIVEKVNTKRRRKMPIELGDNGAMVEQGEMGGWGGCW